MNHLLGFEKELWSKGINLIAGVDEAGRGPWAGPMIVASVILKREALEILEKETFRPKGNPRNYDVSYEKQVKQYATINDSKKLSNKRREELYEFIVNESISYSIEEISVGEIESEGMSREIQKGFLSAVNNLDKTPEYVLTDYVHIKGLPSDTQTNITRGDSLSINIAAASILAKVYRDQLMRKYSLEFPEYGFERHKGYGTKLHLEALKKYGVCKIHRRSFKPVKRFIEESGQPSGTNPKACVDKLEDDN